MRVNGLRNRSVIMARFFKDCFTQWLEAQGSPPEIYQPGGFFGCPPMGWQHTQRGTAIVYVVRKEEPETLHIIMFEREQNRKGLGSPFATLIRFLRLIQRSDSGITHVTGRINAIEGRPADSLETERMKPFYTAHLGGHYFTDEQGIEWVRGSVAVALETLASTRERRS
ncbi:hypothetical protein GCM10023213_47670 [Prosthecobacter algae]|uniref:Uncharacterized protein n=2 Tax=Prosthecobacter algae TaxID=1144682 RepID=A0ABP9PRX7_9BACT